MRPLPADSVWKRLACDCQMNDKLLPMGVGRGAKLRVYSYESGVECSR